jgi:hypothetical protein
MQDVLTITFETVVLSFLGLMAYDFVRNFPPIPSHPRIEVPSLLDDSPEVTNTVPEPLQPPLNECLGQVTGKQESRLDEMTIRELKQMARAAKIRGYGDMRKAQLIEALS